MSGELHDLLERPGESAADDPDLWEQALRRGLVQKYARALALATLAYKRAKQRRVFE